MTNLERERKRRGGGREAVLLELTALMRPEDRRVSYLTGPNRTVGAG